MLDTKQKVINRIAQLSSLAAALSTAPAEKVLQLRDELLALPEDGQFAPGGLSGLNADGSPLQYCISASRDHCNGRFLSDPACVIGSPTQRYRHGYAALQRLYQSTGTTAIRHVSEDMLRFNLPAEGNGFDEAYPDGVFWLGASPDMHGLAVYMDGRRGGHDASWNRFGDWLNHLMPGNTEASGFIAAVRRHASIMSIGLEGSSMENLRAKLYFRLSHKAALSDLGVKLLLREEFPAFLSEVVGDRAIKLSGLVFNIGFHIASQKMFDAKIDVCACHRCVDIDARQWMEVLSRTSSRHGLTPFPVDEVILRDQCAVSYYGIGVDRRGNVRMNLYLKNKIFEHATQS